MMVNATGMIIAEKKHDCRGGIESVAYRYEGNDFLKISEALLAHADPSAVRYDKFPVRPGDKFEIGPFQFRFLERDEWHFDQILAVRERGVITDARCLWHGFGRLADVVYRRFILTLTVWRLAEYDAARVPSWSDVYALQRLMAFLAAKTRQEPPRCAKGLQGYAKDL